MKRLYAFWAGLLLLLLSAAGTNAAENVNIGSLSAGPYCSGGSPTLGFTATGFGATTETFNVQLSDATGSFAAPTIIASPTGGNGSYTPTLSLPTVVTTGTAYAIRIVSSVTNTTSASITGITIGAPVGTPVFTAGATSGRCSGAGIVTYGATSANGGVITYSLDATSAAFPGNSINSATGAVTYAALWVGTATITASAAGCGGPLTATHTATTTLALGAPIFTGSSSSTRCQSAATVSYGATAVGGTLTYSLDATSLGAGNTINSANGDVTYLATWVGTSTITATATGCGGPLTATHTATTTAPIGTPVFTSGATSSRCSGAGMVTYGATSANGGVITYSLDATAAAFPGNSINSTSGAVTYAATWVGTATITASAAGCGGPLTATHTATTTLALGAPVFTAGGSSSRCQGANTVSYGATAVGGTLTYSLDATSLGAGNTINSTNGDVTYVGTWAGTSTITVSAAGCGGPLTATHTATTNPTIGSPVFGAATTPRCQGAATVTYGATSANGGVITYSLDATTAAFPGNSINSTSGAVTYAAGWSGTSTITATATGCGGPLSTPLNITTTPTVGIPSFTGAPFAARCQGSGTVTYAATALNTTGITYTLDATAAAFPGNSINSGTGAVTYAAGWSGTATITASAAGCNGPKTTPVNATTTPSVTTPVFSPGPTAARCQGAGTVTYTATASNTSGPITYSLDATTAGFPGNSFNASTGAVTYSANWAGSSTITASAPGCNGPLTATFNVSTVGIPVFAMGASSSRCQGFGNVTYTATSTNNTGLAYSFTGTGASATYSTTGQIVYDPATTGTVTITATAQGCGTPLTATHTVTINTAVGAVTFNSPNLTPCQGATITYNASAPFASGITYSITTNPTNQATIGATSGVAVFGSSFTGTATVTATASGCGVPTFNTVNLVVRPLVTTPVFNAGPQSTICQNPGTVTYAASANNADSIIYSVTPSGAGTINRLTGALGYNSGFSGNVTITAVAYGCGNSSLSNTFAVTVTPNVGVPSFGALGSTSTRKQGAAIVTYAATASNTSGITYTLSPPSAGNLSTTSGALTYASTFSGLVTITASAAGCAGPTTASHTVTVVQTPIFALGATSSRCQGAGTVSYLATTPNTPGATIAYTLTTSPNDPGTTINASNGTVTYSSGFSGTATITAIATQNSVSTDAATHTATVNIGPKLTSPTPTSKTICSGDNTSIALVATTGAGSNFSWTIQNGNNISGKATGSNLNVINQTLVNASSSVPDSLNYIVTVTSPALCTSVTPDTIKVRVNPQPVLTSIAPVTICSESNISISLGASTQSTFSWTFTAPAKITGASASFGNSSLINQTLTNTDVSGSPTSGTVTYSIVPVSLLGCTGNAGTASVTVNPLPVVAVSGGNSKIICSGASTALTLSANIPSNFTYTTANMTSLGLITGNSGSSGNTINQTLTNSSNSVDDSVSYTIIATTTSSLGCSNTNHPTTVVVRVNPKPAITSASTDSVCSGAMTTTALTATLPSTYAWSIGTVTGNITGQSPNSTSSAVTSIAQTLVNPSNTTPGFVDYIVTPTTTSLPNCTGASKTITVKVNPSPKLTSDSVRTVCSDDVVNFNYTPASSVSVGTTAFAYERNSGVLTIPFRSGSTTGIADTLFSGNILTPTVVDYNFTLTSAAGCKLGGQHLLVTVNPRPDTPGIAVFPRMKLCSGAANMNFSTSRVPNGNEYFRWSVNNNGKAIQKGDSSFSQNALISFPSAGNTTVTVVSNVRGFGCMSKPTNKPMSVASAGGNQAVNVTLFSGNMVAQVSGAKAFQWGFDRKADLDSTLIPGETTQSYDTRKGFRQDVNFYWVMVTFGDDCVQKAYLNGNSPLAVTPKVTTSADVKLYPNPALNVITMEIAGADTHGLVYEVYDLAGRRMSAVRSNAAKTRIPVADFAPGYYTVICTQDGLRIAAARFTKN